MTASRLRIVVSGMMAGVPGHGGATWAVLQYVLGLRRLGHEVLFLEPVKGGWSSRPEVARYFEGVLTRFGLRGGAALLEPDSREAFGIPYGAVRDWTRDADLLLNLSGLLRVPELLEPIPLRVYVDLDPAFTQLWSEVEGVDMGFAGHHRFATVGLSLGRPECTVPTCRKRWIPTLPPVVLEEWSGCAAEGRDDITTVANWRGYGSILHEGVLHGQKAHAFRELIELPRHTRESLLLALSIHEGDGGDRAALEEAGWALVDPAAVASTPDLYRAFVSGSRAEIGVAKTGYTASLSGWFSDRSACYLASGRPVVAQDTGFSQHLPVGDGLLTFRTVDDAVEALEELGARYAMHARAARELAEAHLDSDLVLSRLLDAVERDPEPVAGVRTQRRAGTRELQVALDTVFATGTSPSRDGGTGGVRIVDRRTHPYQTSCSLEELQVDLPDGTGREILFKDGAPDALVQKARGVKPPFLLDPSREGKVYRTLLAPEGMGPALYGVVDTPEAGRHWLFLERSRGVELYQIGNLDTWAEVARWLGRFHRRFERHREARALAERGILVRHDAMLLRRWLTRARGFGSRTEKPGSPSGSLGTRLERAHQRVLRCLLSEPPTLVHGEFYPSNVLVDASSDPVRVIPVDWETAGWGPGLLDLAALVAGDWTETERDRLALAYFQGLMEPRLAPVRSPAAFIEALTCARLQLAIQWMGWSPTWSPPPEHVQDWTREADILLERLGE